MDSAKPTEKSLRAELEAAIQLHKQANLEFWRLSSDIPSQLPYPDGVQRLRNAARAQVTAMREEYQALKRLNAWYASQRSIPETDN